MNYIEFFEAELSEQREQLYNHTLYKSLDDIEGVRAFMKFHVFAVWDFMSLLKSLQQKLTCTTSPWLPPKSRLASRLINEIVLCEESDDLGEGLTLSHFEMYLEAMKEVGADATAIEQLIELVRSNPDLDWSSCGAVGGVWKFMAATFSFTQLKPHQTAAAFLYGREDIIPEIFQRVLSQIKAKDQPKYYFFRKYLERHIHVDSETHAPMARRLLVELCGEEVKLWRESLDTAKRALEARIELWNYIERECVRVKKMPKEITLPSLHRQDLL